MGSLRQDGHDQTDEETTGNIDKKCAVGESRPHSLPNIGSQPKAGYRAHEPADANSEVLAHVSASLCEIMCSSRSQVNDGQVPRSQFRILILCGIVVGN